MKLPFGQRLLVIYSGVLTLVFAGTVLMGATSGTRDASFDQITVHRINVVEPDGTLRMVISNAAEAPGSPYHNKIYPRPGRMDAGIIFMNNEGTENGGLIFGGRRSSDGKVSSFGHLSFDSYDQDQTMVIQADQDDTTRKATYIKINDEPAWNEFDALNLMQRTRDEPAAQRQAALQSFLKTHPTAKPRIYLGTRDDHSSDLVLDDAQGRPRIVVKVAVNGSPVLQFLDSRGKVIEQLPQTSTH